MSSLTRYALVYALSLVVSGLIGGQGQWGNSLIAMLVMAFFLSIPCLVMLALFDFIEKGLVERNVGAAIFIIAPVLGYLLPGAWTYFVVGEQKVDWSLGSLSGAGLILGAFWSASSLLFERRA